MSESTMEINKYGAKVWRNSRGNRHRADGPAVEYADGGKAWWVEGKRHRIDGPATECSTGSKEWWVEGKRHRIDGPATEYSTGTKEWWAEGKIHRIDGPAVEWSNGDKVWWIEGELLGYDDLGFWALWERLSDEDRANPTLLSHLPGVFNV